VWDSVTAHFPRAHHQTTLRGKPFILSGARPFDEVGFLLRKLHCALHPQRDATPPTRGNEMARKQKPVRKSSKKIADARRVRFGSGWTAPAVRASDKATNDTRAVRFGSGWTAPSLRK
jgi:hypothetical protein